MPSFRGSPVDVVIDVRSKVEFWLGHLPGAVNIPVDTLPDALAAHPEISPASRVLVYCASGGRSAMAAQQLKARGIRLVVDAGGLGAAREDFVA